jgi:hypothetical protein
VSCSPVFREEQYGYCQSAAPAGWIESKRVEKAAKPNSVDANLLAIFFWNLGSERRTLSTGLWVCAGLAQRCEWADAVAALGATKTLWKQSDSAPPLSRGRVENERRREREDGEGEADRGLAGGVEERVWCGVR